MMHVRRVHGLWSLALQTLARSTSKTLAVADRSDKRCLSMSEIAIVDGSIGWDFAPVEVFRRIIVIVRSDDLV